MEKSNNNNGKLVGALLVGAAIGGALGILFAPNKGSETRKKIVAKGGDLSESIKDKITDLFEKGQQEAEVLKDKVNHSMNHSSIKA
jgi:gas vesicle protein